jgi:hypothetical protein
MRTEQTRREKRIHRESMALYVFAPSRDAAFASMMIGAGVGVTIAAVSAKEHGHELFASVLFIVALMSLFSGVGWLLMIKARLNDYYYDIMQDRAIEETRISEHDEPAHDTRRIPNGRGDIVAELPNVGKLNPREWRDVAHAIRVLESPISQAGLARGDGKVMSQPQYKWWYDYMIKNKYMTSDPNTLTPDGEKKLDSYITPPAPR